MKTRLTLAALFSFILSGCATLQPNNNLTNSSSNDSTAVHEYQLDNGMKIFVKEDHRAPVVASMVWYKVGSSYENNGTTGVSHVLEHMMFKGTEKYGPGEFSRIIAENGGKENAFTSRDYTAYFQRLHKDKLETSIRMEADRMRGMKVADEEFAKEIQVVIEERRMRTEDAPESLTYEAFSASAYTTNPYRRPVIGWMNDLENMTAQDIRDWYQVWYAPNNASLVVAGDVDPEQVYQLAKKYFAPLKPIKHIAPPKPQLEPEQKGLRRIIVKAPAELPYLLMGYKVPSVNGAKEEWEPYALDVLANVLDGGNSARFAKNLVRGQQVAAGAGAGYSPFSRLNTLFLFDGNPARGHSISELEQAIREQIELIKTEPVSTDELARIKAQVIAADVYQLDSVFYQAMKIGQFETVGLDWRLSDQYAERIQQVTAEQVQKVAKKYLIDDSLTVAVLEPQPMAGNQAHHSNAGSHH
ncbi:MAG TPA: insulinase family protein [Candidatus Tenderia electrophaga]|uniref:Insulinase family protein n=1 Tax=Candidatus Tenderia electrophaga TaxID=1748243 RepID=A0A832J6D4_9GAMM|nr:insulinase family protein [Candidatus Tenderia electrophaga]